MCIAGATPECLDLVPIFEALNQVVEVAAIPLLIVFLFAGMLACYEWMLNSMLAALRHDNARLDAILALFPEEEKPKRKNDELVFSADAINERMNEIHGIESFYIAGIFIEEDDGTLTKLFFDEEGKEIER
jgi:hypothetical protein